MIYKSGDFFLGLKTGISKEIKIAKEINALSGEISGKNSEDERSVKEQIKTLKKEMKKAGDGILNLLVNAEVANPLKGAAETAPAKIQGKPGENARAKKPGFFDRFLPKFSGELSDIERSTLKRIKETEKEQEIARKEIKKPSSYVRTANKMFSDYSAELIKKWKFTELQEYLIKSNLNFLLKSYVSVIILTTAISFAVSVFIFIFFLFFNVSSTLPLVTLANGNIWIRILETFWIMLVVPLTTVLLMYTYPSLEKDSIGRRIDRELPFATINMAAISGSMIDPTKIFSIIITTHEYPNLQKEFTKLINNINVLGYDFVTALRNSTFTTASKKLSELFNGLATTISSGGDLPKFFNERADTMLFEYNLDKEKATKTAETFMDIYISVVIAAPMILMLLLMMMRISGLGLALSSSMITLIMVLSVTMVNIGFLVFLNIKQSNI